MTSLLGGVVDLIRNRVSTQYPVPRANSLNPFTVKQATNATQQMQAYGAVSTLFAVVNKIANSTGSVPWHLYRQRKDGRKIYGPNELDRPEIVSHVVLEAWNKPNPFYWSSLFVESTQQHIDLTGEAFWIIGRNQLSSMPLELWLVSPDKMQVVPSSESFIAGYIYTGANGEKIPFDPEDVIHIKMPNPMDPYRGLGPVQALLVDLEASHAAGLFNRNFFLNDATPGGTIEVPNSLTDDEFDRLREQWAAGHQGVNNAHRVAILEQGASFHGQQFSMRDMQFSELRNLSREMIREAFSLHPHMLGLTEDINRANAEAAETVFARWVLKPRLDRIKDALNHQFLPLFGTSTEGLEFDFEDPSLEDSEAENAKMLAQAQATKFLTDAGGEFSSVIEALGLPEMEKKSPAELEAEKPAPPQLPGQQKSDAQQGGKQGASLGAS